MPQQGGYYPPQQQQGYGPGGPAMGMGGGYGGGMQQPGGGYGYPHAGYVPQQPMVVQQQKGACEESVCAQRADVA